MNKTEIVNNALDRLNHHTGLNGNWMPLNLEIDGEIDFLFENKKLHLYVEVKKELRNHQLPQILEMAKKYKHFMVIADRIFPALKETLRENKIGYHDAAGNIYVNTPEQFVWLDGHKHTETEKPVTTGLLPKPALKPYFT